jgi:hypothetical protein
VYCGCPSFVNVNILIFGITSRRRRNKHEEDEEEKEEDWKAVN